MFDVCQSAPISAFHVHLSKATQHCSASSQASILTCNTPINIITLYAGSHEAGWGETTAWLEGRPQQDASPIQGGHQQDATSVNPPMHEEEDYFARWWSEADISASSQIASGGNRMAEKKQQLEAMKGENSMLEPDINEPITPTNGRAVKRSETNGGGRPVRVSKTRPVSDNSRGKLARKVTMLDDREVTMLDDREGQVEGNRSHSVKGCDDVVKQVNSASQPDTPGAKISINLAISTETELELMQKPLHVLRPMCKERGLPVSGVKAEVVARLLKHSSCNTASI